MERCPVSQRLLRSSHSLLVFVSVLALSAVTYFGPVRLVQQQHAAIPAGARSLQGGRVDPDAPTDGPKLAGDPRPDYPQEAMEFYNLALRDENGNIPLDGLTRAKAQADAMLAAEGDSPTAGGISRGAWSWIGPGNIGGRTRSLAVNPSNTNIIYAGTVGGGIWKTVNGGTSWTPVNDFLANLAVSTIIFRPGDPNTMFAGTGEGFYNTDGLQGAGIFRSNDGGATWGPLPSTQTTDFRYVNRLAMSADGTILLAATRTGLFRSTNYGIGWTKVLTPNALPAPTPAFPDVLDVKFRGGSSTGAVASGYSGNAYYSTDGGQTWHAAATGPSIDTAGSLKRVEIGVSQSSPLTVYLSADASSGQIWKSTDGGVNYSLQSTPAHLSGQGWYDNVIWVDPTNANTIIVGGVDLYRNTAGGVSTFTKISSWQVGPPLGSPPFSAHADQHAIVSDPGFNGTSNKKVYFGNDGGMFRTDDPYAAPDTSLHGYPSIGFADLNNNFGATQFYGAGGFPATGKVYGGTQDNASILYTTGGGTSGWTAPFGGDGGKGAIDQGDANYMYGEYVYLRLHRVTNGVGPASSIYCSGANPGPTCLSDAANGYANFIAPFILDPNNQSRLLGGGGSLWRSDNVKAATPGWTAISAFNTNGLPPGFFWPVSAIAVAPGNSDVIYVGYNNGDVYKTTNGTSGSPVWGKVDDNATALPDRKCESLTFDPSNANTIYATFGGFNGHNVSRSTNGGSSWTDVTGAGATGLPDVPVRAFAVHPGNSNYIYAGTDIGVFASSDGGANWALPGDGPANVAVFELFWMGTKLVAATHGRGVFTANVPLPATTTITLSPGTLYFGATKNGAGGAIAAITPSQTVTVGFSGVSPTWTATVDQPWVTLSSAFAGGGEPSPAAGSGTGQFTVTVNNPGNVIGGQTSMQAVVTVWAPGQNASKTLNVNLNIQQTTGGSAAAFGRVDTPAQNASGLQGAIGLTGWSLDDVAVNDVKVYRTCFAFDNPASCQMKLGNSVVYVGQAGFVAGARPDVEAAFPTYPQAARAGWGLQILSNQLPHVPNMTTNGGQGTMALFAIATDLEGHETLLGRTSADHTPTTVTLNNDAIAKPFGTLDTPAQGATVSGNLANFGWALTPDLNTSPDGTDILIPLTGSTMVVFVDGVSKGTVAYNQCRGNVGNPVPAGVYCNDDVSNIFGNATPQPPLTPRSSNPTKYRNLDAQRGPIGAFNINTNTLSNGVHTIQWSVTDSAARADGIGSRFFTVVNGGPVANQAQAAAAVERAPAASRGDASQLDTAAVMRDTVAVRTGFDLKTPYDAVGADKGGVHAVRMPQAGRLEVIVGRVDAGYLVANGELRDLPIGSTLDASTGTFNWNPPVGYFGVYRLVFVTGGQKTIVDVTVAPDGTIERTPVRPPGGAVPLGRRGGGGGW